MGGAHERPDNPLPLDSAIESAEIRLDAIGRQAIKKIEMGVRLSKEGQSNVICAIEEWIRARDGRETKTCNLCGHATRPNWGFTWGRDKAYTCTKCEGGILLSAGEHADV